MKHQLTDEEKRALWSGFFVLKNGTELAPYERFLDQDFAMMASTTKGKQIIMGFRILKLGRVLRRAGRNLK